MIAFIEKWYIIFQHNHSDKFACVTSRTCFIFHILSSVLLWFCHLAEPPCFLNCHPKSRRFILQMQEITLIVLCWLQTYDRHRGKVASVGHKFMSRLTGTSILCQTGVLFLFNVCFVKLTTISIVSELVMGWVGVTGHVMLKERKKLLRELHKFCNVFIWTC